jgi:hypothetical protein
MLDAFTSVGADGFVLTWRTLQDEDIQVRKHWSAGYIRRNLPQLLGLEPTFVSPGAISESLQNLALPKIPNLENGHSSSMLNP